VYKLVAAAWIKTDTPPAKKKKKGGKLF